VRITPSELHINDPSYYDTIYASHPRKRDRSAEWAGMADADLHRQRRAALNPFFSKRGIVRLEPRITSKVQKLCDRLAEHMAKGKIVDLKCAYMALTMDVITEYCYGTSYDYLHDPNFKPNWLLCIESAFDNAHFRRALPWLSKIMSKFPDSFIMTLMPAMSLFIQLRKDIHAEVTDIFYRKQKGDEKGERESTIQALRDSQILSPQEKSLARLKDEGQILIAAGSETTAKTLTETTFWVLHTAGVLDRLREELKDVMPNARSIPTWTELERLPFLVSMPIRTSLNLRVDCIKDVV
jgi:cytochrome P450